MSTTPLDTNFKDDILASSNAKRKYQMTYNDDGTVSFQDVTAYSQMGSAFGAKEVNEERAAINKINSDRIVTLDEIDLVTEPGFFVDAMAVKQLNRNLEATKNNLSCLQVLECGSKIITTPDGLYVLKGDLPEGRNYVAHVINGDYNANSAKIEKVIIQDNNVVVQFVGAVNNPFRLNYVIFSVP